MHGLKRAKVVEEPRTEASAGDASQARRRSVPSQGPDQRVATVAVSIAVEGFQTLVTWWAQ
jgi:hypothetical protein